MVLRTTQPETTDDIRAALAHVRNMRATADRVVYFGGSAGDDVYGDGSAAKPFATYDRAMEDVPEDLGDYHIIVKGKAGAYTSTRYQDRRKCGRFGQFVLECEDPPVYVAGPFTITAATELGSTGNNSGMDVQVAGAGWAVDAYYRKFIRFLDGVYIGCVSPVFSNSEEHILFPTDGWGGPAPGDTFEILEPAMSITWTGAPTFTWNGAVGTLRSQYAIINTSFQVLNMDPADPVDPYSYGAYVWDGNGNVVTGVMEFFGDKAEFLFEHLGGLFNSWALDDFTQLADPTLIAWWDSGGLSWILYPSLQFVGCSTPPVATDSDGIVEIVGYSNGGEWQIGIDHYCSRQGVFFGTPRGESMYFMVSSINADHHSFSSCQYGYLAPYRGAYAIRVDDRSYLDLVYIYIANATGNAILCTDLSEMMLFNVRGDTAAITQYGLSAGAGVKIKKEGTTDLAGLLGEIYFSQSSSIESWPTTTNVKTDSKGSFVIG